MKFILDFLVIFGLISSLIPDQNRNPSTRAVFGSGHIKQSLGAPVSNFLNLKI